MAKNQIEEYDPAKAERILAMLAAEASYREIMRRQNTGYGTIVRLREAHPQRFEEWRSLAAKKAQQAAELAMDRIIERLEDEEDPVKSFKELAISYGIFTDKSLSLNDQPTAIVEQRKGISIEEAQKIIEAARKKVREEAITA